MNDTHERHGKIIDDGPRPFCLTPGGSHLTPGMARFLALHRQLTADLGREPFRGELAQAMGGIRKQSVERYIEKLNAAGFQVSCSLHTYGNQHTKSPQIRPAVIRTRTPAEAEVARLRSLVERFAAWSRSGELLMDATQRLIRDQLCNDADAELTQRPTEAA